ncbi:hypothetical protein BJV78DRAFT_1278855 [Lactifluus subvellereus]|nr:hypothetical protein BJV78DRAFT_1278855 [Lactifluus subvellereus]
MPSRRGFYAVDTHKIHSHAQQRGGTPADKPFTSALDLSSPRPTALRRRGSDGGAFGSRDSSKLSHHARSRAIDSTSELHPLRRSSTTTETARYDTGSTRPRLSRALSASSPVLARPDPPPPPEKAESHRTVLAHEISPNDTLAGVALKYGISVTELRRANQLWASDSIHLRQVLYVPLDKARHANLEAVASLLAQGSDGEDTARDSVSLSDQCSLDPSPVVRRVPPTSLSFFPPPSSSASALPEARSTPMSPSHSPAAISTPPRGSNMTSNLRANALSSLFSVLPINASTRDEIMSRLSIDSVSNSTTGTTSDEGEHELTPVPATPKPRSDTSVPIPGPFLTNPRRKRPARTWLSDSDSRDADGRQEPSARDVEHIALASSPIHTTQMQPAPVMQLPDYIMRSPSKGATPNNSHNGARRSSGDHSRTR